MDRDTKARIEDFFTAAELAEYLQLPVGDLIERFEDEIEEALEDIDELMGVRNGVD